MDNSSNLVSSKSCKLFKIKFNDKHIFYAIDDDRLYVVDVVNNSLKTFKKKTFQYGMNTFKSFYINEIL